MLVLHSNFFLFSYYYDNDHFVLYLPLSVLREHVFTIFIENSKAFTPEFKEHFNKCFMYHIVKYLSSLTVCHFVGGKGGVMLKFQLNSSILCHILRNVFLTTFLKL